MDTAPIPAGIDIIIYRLDLIDEQLSKLMTTEVYETQVGHLERRISNVEDELKQVASRNRQTMLTITAPIITFILGVLLQSIG